MNDCQCQPCVDEECRTDKSIANENRKEFRRQMVDTFAEIGVLAGICAVGGIICFVLTAFLRN